MSSAPHFFETNQPIPERYEYSFWIVSVLVIALIAAFIRVKRM
jgi:hypothetical protein